MTSTTSTQLPLLTTVGNRLLLAAHLRREADKAMAELLALNVCTIASIARFCRISRPTVYKMGARGITALHEDRLPGFGA